jgi:GAF domain-containing protein
MSGTFNPSSDRFQRVVNALNVSYWEWTPGSDEIHASENVAEWMEFTPGNWSIDRLFDWVHPDDRAVYRAWLVAFLKSDQRRSEITFRYVRRDGRAGWAQVHAWVERDASGRATRLTGTVTDITEEKTREAEIRDNAARQAASVEVLKAIAASAGDVRPVFELITRRLAELCHSRAGLLEFDGETFHLRTLHGVPGELAEPFRRTFPLALDPGGSHSFDRAVLERRTIHIPDVSQDPQIANTVQTRTMRGRSIVCAPMLRDGKPIGAIALNDTLDGPGGFSDSQIAFLEMFAEQAVIAITSAETYRALQERNADLQESLEYQTATADVLKVISRSTFDLLPVLETLAAMAAKLCAADQGLIARLEDGRYNRIANYGFPAEVWSGWQAAGPLPIESVRGYVGVRTLIEGTIIHIDDAATDPNYPSYTAERARQHTTLGVPLKRDGETIGSFVLARQRVERFTDRQIELVTAFADQAVIAIENTRLLTEQREALEQQTATAEILAVINASPGDLAPVFETILAKAHVLCGAEIGSLGTFENGMFRKVARHGYRGEADAFLSQPYPAEPQHAPLLRGEVIHIADVMAHPWDDSERARAFFASSDLRAWLEVPLWKDGALLGTISGFRREPRAFSDKEIKLLQSFAAQAVIAMENARLLGALRDRTAELAERNDAFAERIDQQAATIDVLKAMSASPGDPQPVFDQIVRRAKELCNALEATLFQFDGALVHHSAVYGDVVDLASPESIAYQNSFPMIPDPGSLSCRAILDRQIIHVRDTFTDPGLSPVVRDLFIRHGLQSQLSIPLLRDGAALGAITINAVTPGGFSDSQVALLQTFAEQAVIAITSAETYRALQERTAALALRNTEFGERIEQQAATIDVLKAMSGSPDDLQTVFDLIARRAAELCESRCALWLYRDGLMRLVSGHGFPPELTEQRKRQPPSPPDHTLVAGQALRARSIVHLRDALDDPSLSPLVRELGGGAIVGVPLLLAGEPVGVIVLNGNHPGGFTDSQIALLQTFAEQAVIAITSAETYRALQTRTAELTRSVTELQALEEVTRAVNASLDLDTVLETIIRNAVALGGADEGMIYEFDEAEQVFVPRSSTGMTEQRVAGLRDRRIRIGETYLGRSAAEREVVYVDDVANDATLIDPDGVLRGVRAVLAVPLIKDDAVMGGLVIRSRGEGGFPSSIVPLMRTFALQCVLAIDNARLFRRLAERGEEARRARVAAEQALSDLRRTQDRLLQTEKLASLGQLTAGIAHEIKNPLNFVNNFSELSVDLLDELNDAVASAQATVGDDLRAEIDDITATLKLNLEKIAHHGKRADSIVKNMLLHSRTGTSEHRMIGVNSLVEEALNLAYHGERAKTPGFNITMETDLDAKAGEVDAYPQELTRVLLNMFSNGFYAAHKRAAEPGFEPTLKASTHDLGDQVEIRVRDNGTGIPDAEREKIFEPFFTTKPAGEGTGLGLSLSFDIVVKQHGGGLAVDSRVGEFTEFTITLPRRIAEGAAP